MATIGRDKFPPRTERPTQPKKTSVDSSFSFASAVDAPASDASAQGDSPLVNPHAEDCRNGQLADSETVATNKPPQNKGGRPKKAKTKEEREAVRAAIKAAEKAKKAQERLANDDRKAWRKENNPCKLVLPEPTKLATVYKCARFKPNSVSIYDDFSRFFKKKNETFWIVDLEGWELYGENDEYWLNVTEGHIIPYPNRLVLNGVDYWEIDVEKRRGDYCDRDGNWKTADEIEHEAKRIEKGSRIQRKAVEATSGHRERVDLDDLVADLVDVAEGSEVAEAPAKKSNLLTGSDGLTGYMSGNSAKKIKKVLSAWIPAVQAHHQYERQRGKRSAFFPVFITLTLPAEQMHSDKDLKASCLKNFLQWLRDAHKVQFYLWRAEVQMNGRLHFHIVADRSIHHGEIRKHWNAIMQKKGYLTAYRDAQYARYMGEDGELHFSATEIEIERAQEAVTKKLQNAKPNPQTGEKPKMLYDKALREAAIDLLKKRFVEASSNDFRDPNSTDIRRLGDMDNAVSYLAKYMAKTDEENADWKEKKKKKASETPTDEEVTENVKSLQYRNLEGRLWTCSHAISKLDYFRKMFHSSVRVRSNDYTRTVEEPLYAEYVNYMHCVAKRSPDEKLGVSFIDKDDRQVIVSQFRKIAHFLEDRFNPILVELENFHRQVFNYLYHYADDFESLPFQPIPARVLTQEMKDAAYLDMERLLSHRQAIKEKSEALTDTEQAMRKEMKRIAWKAKREAEWEEAAQKIAIEEAKIKANRTADQEREEIIRLLIPTVERNYFTLCKKADAPRTQIADIEPREERNKSTFIDFRADRYDLTGFEGLTESTDCPF